VGWRRVTVWQALKGQEYVPNLAPPFTNYRSPGQGSQSLHFLTSLMEAGSTTLLVTVRGLWGVSYKEPSTNKCPFSQLEGKG
jgi:hypothetical protein